MLEIKEYVKVESLEEAYELNQKKTNRIVGGMLWMKMGNNRIQKAIDLSGLGLDTIEETEEEFSIGCMVSLRQLELHQGLDALTQGAMRESVRHIVGVQFRNLATIGGSLFGRYGFSDVLTMFLALDSYVELYHGGIVSMEEFAGMPRNNDILVRVHVKKVPMRCVYLSHRNTKTDFPVLTCAVSVSDTQVRAAVGARPGKAITVPISFERMQELKKTNSEDAVRKLAEELAEQIPTQSNMRGSAQYRTHLAKVLLRRSLMQILEGEN
jgi:CO/xanthine dehydrogenase FAD-binding subunit